MEGVGLYHFSEDVLPHLADVPAEIGDVLSRVNLPVDQGARWRPRRAHSEPRGAGRAAARGRPPEARRSRRSRVRTPPRPKPSRSRSRPPKPAARRRPGSVRRRGQRAASRRAEALALLENDNVVLDETGVADLEGRPDRPARRGRPDQAQPGAQDHGLAACARTTPSSPPAARSPTTTTAAASTSPPSTASPSTRPTSTRARSPWSSRTSTPPIRPDEIGTPWAIAGTGYFTDSGHQDHLHIGFKQQIGADSKPGARRARAERRIRATTRRSRRSRPGWPPRRASAACPASCR